MTYTNVFHGSGKVKAACGRIIVTVASNFQTRMPKQKYVHMLSQRAIERIKYLLFECLAIAFMFLQLILH